MATATDVVYRALSYNLNRQAESAIEPNELQQGISVLNDMMTGLESDNCYLGYTYITDGTQTVTVSPGVLLGITQNLAIQLAPLFGGKVSPLLERNAMQSMNTILAAGLTPPQTAYPSNLPRGAGRNRWDQINNTFFDGLIVPVAEITFSANTTATTIAAVDTPVLIAGAWTETVAKKFTTTAAGLLTYTGEDTQSFDIQSRFTVEVAAKHVNIYAYLNSTQVTTSLTTDYVETKSVLPLYSSIVLKKNDTLQFYVENIDDATDILISSATVGIR